MVVCAGLCAHSSSLPQNKDRARSLCREHPIVLAIITLQRWNTESRDDGALLPFSNFYAPAPLDKSIAGR